MENDTIKQLKAIAKERGVRGYYKLRKAELIHAWNNQHLVGHQISLQKTCKISKISLLKVCKRLKILASSC